MRVIRTELYFDNQVRARDGRRPPSNAGIATAWFGAPDTNVEDVNPKLIFDYFERYKKDDAVLPHFIDVALRNELLRPSFDFSRETIQNGAIVEFVLNSDVVIERSPPTTELLEKLAHQSPAIFIGTFLGVGAASGSYPLMLLTVPLGIVVIGSAIGVSKGLEKGLNKAISTSISNLNRRK